jgi:hypothetical protein
LLFTFSVFSVASPSILMFFFNEFVA